MAISNFRPASFEVASRGVEADDLDAETAARANADAALDVRLDATEAEIVAARSGQANLDARIDSIATTATAAVPATRTITAAVLATGGGDLTANRTITVAKATGAEAQAGTDDTKAVTPLALATPLTIIDDALAALDVRLDDAEGTLDGLASTSTPPSVYGLLDAGDTAAMTLDVDGTIRQSNLVLDVLNSMPVDEILRRVMRKPSLRSSISHRISYGQSLSLGNGSGRLSLPGSFYDAVMFNANGVHSAGPRAQEGLGTVAQNHASLIPYEERPITGTAPSGNLETPLGTAIRMIKRLLIAENGIQPEDQDYIILGSAPGQSNTAIAGLSKPSSPYTRVMDDVNYGLTRAQGLGQSYAVDAVYWSQGEADIGLSTARATYAAALVQLYTDFNTDIKAITKQAHDIKLISYQCSIYSQTNPNIALAQYDASLTQPNIILATAVYALEHIAADNAHLTAIGYANLGAYFGYCDKRVVIDGGTWEPFAPTTVTRQGTILDVAFPDTGYPLVIDDVLFPTVTNAGFSAIDGGSVNNPITEVTVIGRNRIKIVLTSAVAGTLRYGFTSWGGNLRDNNPLDIQSFRRKPLYAPCLIFEKAFT
jgi:Carbohydrate esterase, sialic acid-specific acetylesterase